MTGQHGKPSKSQEVQKLFFLLSGEHLTLPFSEVKSILEAEGHRFRAIGKLRQVMRIEANANCVNSIARRAALTRACCAEILYTEAETAKILGGVRSAPIERWVGKGDSFVVRVRRIGKSAPNIMSTFLEQEIGAVVLDKAAGARVNLTAPSLTFLGVLTGDKFVFGLKLADIQPKPFVERRPRKRPFFHPSAMPAKLARCMVNLARSKAGEVVLDPFCGTAAFLIEAGLVDCKTAGCDVQRRMIRGSLRNLRHYRVSAEGMLRADARRLPFQRVDCIVTDPPYGRSATTLGRRIEDIVEEFLPEAGRLIPRGKRLCIASPRGIEIAEKAKRAGFKLVESHFVYVHRSLTREIDVLERI